MFGTFDYNYCDEICDKIKYLISEKSSIANSINHNFARIKLIRLILYLVKKYCLFIM